MHNLFNNGYPEMYPDRTVLNIKTDLKMEYLDFFTKIQFGILLNLPSTWPDSWEVPGHFTFLILTFGDRDSL